jgi:hypothetical protein
MTSTLSPNDTGDIRLGEGTRDLTYLTQRPALRRPEASGEFPFYRPGGVVTVDGQQIPIAETSTLVGVAELARLAAGETLVLPLGAPPSVPRHAAPTVYRPDPDRRPDKYRGRRRKAGPWWGWLLVGAGSTLVLQSAALLAALAVVR